MDPSNLPMLLQLLGQQGGQAPSTQASLVGSQQSMPQGMNAAPQNVGNDNTGMSTSLLFNQLGF